MNKTLSLLLLLGLVSFRIDAQETSKSSQSSIIIDLSPEITEEAALRGVTNDRIYISFTMKANCEIFDFKVLRPAQLKSFNLLVEKDKEKIIRLLKSTFKCNHNKEQKFQLQ